MAHTSGAKLSELGIRFNAAYSSPLGRAYETAKMLAPGVDIVRDDRLIELLFGQFEGKVTDELLADGECPFKFFRKDPARYNASTPQFGGESLEDLIARTRSFMQEVIEPLAGTDKKVLISGHGAQNRGLLMHVRGTSDLNEFWGTGLQDNCGITQVSLTLSDEGHPVYGALGECKTYYDKSLSIDPEKLLRNM